MRTWMSLYVQRHLARLIRLSLDIGQIDEEDLEMALVGLLIERSEQRVNSIVTHAQLEELAGTIHQFYEQHGRISRSDPENVPF